MIGTRFGNWLVVEELGRGVSGTVWRAQAFEVKPGEPAVAAVKVLDAALGRDPAFQARFPGEMLGLHRLTHPNIARFYDAGVQAGLVYYAAELAPGMDLATRLKAQATTLDEPGLNWQSTVFRIAVQAARALKHAHHRSILHRDLKPANLILADDGTLKVADFGVAKAFSIPPLALPAEPMGTVCYLAPEHFTGKPLTRRSDLYALGGVLYTLVCGRPPFTAPSAAEYMHKHCYMLPDRPINFVPRLPVEVDELICSLLMKDPARRPASAAALLDDLEHLRGKLERKGDRVLPPPEAVDPTGLHAPLELSAAEPLAENDAGRRRDRFLRGSLLLAFFLLVVGLILYAFLRPRPSAAELWAQAQPLLASDNPDDWDRARDDYLDKIERWHPGAYAADLNAVRQKVQDRRELRRALHAGGDHAIGSEPERLYRRGLALASYGDFAGAGRIWTALPKAYAASRWTRLAEIGVAELARPEASSRPLPFNTRASVAAVLETVKKMKNEGQTSAADEIVSALHSLYGDNPEILAMLK